MNRAGPVFPQCSNVLRRPISFVLCKAILWIELVVFIHETVPSDLGDDRGRRDRCGFRIPLDHRKRRHRQPIEVYSINENLRGGAKYLRQQLDRFGHYHLALAAYNAGPGRIRNGLVPQIPETQAYVDNVLLNWSRLSGIGRQATIISTTAGPNTQLRPTIGRKASVSTF